MTNESVESASREPHVELIIAAAVNHAPGGSGVESWPKARAQFEAWFATLPATVRTALNCAAAHGPGVVRVVRRERNGGVHVRAALPPHVAVAFTLSQFADKGRLRNGFRTWVWSGRR